MKLNTHVAVLLISLLTLSGCGFALRGTTSDLSERFKLTYLEKPNSGDSYLSSQVRRLININGGKVVDRIHAQTQVSISPISSTSRQIALSGDGSLKEYEKIYSTTVRITELESGIQLGSRVLRTTRFVQLDSRKILAGEEQSAVSKQSATRDLARAVIHYLESF